MKKYQNIILGLVVGFGAFWLFEKVGEKDCGCGGHTEENLEGELLEPNPPNATSGKKGIAIGEPTPKTCEEAVAIVMAELRAKSIMPEGGFRTRERLELAQCRKMANER
tara:strand:+ start:1424 stop:1750 length:327 start_codon:yes stop_codon:yes gene_type:complete